MITNDCEQLRLDNDWSLARTNACHIAVMNDEMGMLAGAQTEIQSSLGVIGMKIDLIFGAWGIIVACIIALVIKKMWGNGK